MRHIKRQSTVEFSWNSCRNISILLQTIPTEFDRISPFTAPPFTEKLLLRFSIVKTSILYRSQFKVSQRFRSGIPFPEQKLALIFMKRWGIHTLLGLLFEIVGKAMHYYPMNYSLGKSIDHPRKRRSIVMNSCNNIPSIMGESEF